MALIRSIETAVDEALKALPKIGHSVEDITRKVAPFWEDQGRGLKLWVPPHATEHLGGINPKFNFVSQTGESWMFKYGYAQSLRNTSEEAAHSIGALVGHPVAEGFTAKIAGDVGFLQKLYPNALEVGVQNDFSPTEAQDIMHHAVFSQLIRNYDLHGGNFVHTPEGVKGIDLGLAFRNTELNVFDEDVPNDVLRQIARGHIEHGGPILQNAMDYAQYLQDTPAKPYKAVLKSLLPRDRVKTAMATKETLVSTVRENLLKRGVPSLNPRRRIASLPPQDVTFRGQGPADFHLRWRS